MLTKTEKIVLCEKYKNYGINKKEAEIKIRELEQKLLKTSKKSHPYLTSQQGLKNKYKEVKNGNVKRRSNGLRVKAD